MNPYYQNQQVYQQPQQNSFPQPVYQAQGGQMPNIQAMYSTLQPYNSHQFLLSTFGNKPDLINVFLTLTHEDKLMMYMLMEEKKLQGEIKDKANYQRLLQEIAQKAHNYNLFHHNAPATTTKEEDKSIEMENKINDIVDKTFQKLNMGGSNQPREVRHDEVVLSEPDEEEWVESVAGIAPEFKQNNSFKELAVENEKVKAGQPVYSNFTLDSGMEEAFTHQIGLKTHNEMEKKSIWDLELGDEQLKQEEPSLKDIFHSNLSEHGTSVPEQHANNYITPVLPSPPMQIKSHYADAHQFTGPDYSMSLYANANANVNPLSYSENGLPVFSKDNGLFEENYYQSEKGAVVKDCTGSVRSAENKENIEGGASLAFTFGTAMQEDPSQEGTAEENIIIEIPEPEILKIDEPFNIDEPEMVEAVVNEAVEPMEPMEQRQTQEDYVPQDVIPVPATYESVVNIDTSDLPPEFTADNSNFLDFQEVSRPAQPVTQSNFDIELLGGVNNFPNSNVHHQNNSPEQPTSTFVQPTQTFDFAELSMPVQMPTETLKEQPLASVISQAYTSREQTSAEEQFVRPPSRSLSFANTQNYDMIASLKVEMNKESRNFVEKQLKSQSFECNSEFYLAMMDYLHELELRNSPEFSHFNQQYKMVKDLHEETTRFTAAVEEDEQDKVAESVMKSKQLMNMINKNSQKTQNLVVSILDRNNTERGFLYKFGRLLVDSFMNNQIIPKVVAQENPTQIENSFYVLYTLQKLNSLQRLQSNTEKIMAYCNQQYDRYRELDANLLEQLEQQPEQYPKYVQFIKGFVSLLEICERIVLLLKVCCMRTQVNMVKTLKICKDVKSKYASYRERDGSAGLLPEKYKETLRAGVMGNHSCYELHSSFASVYESDPVCNVCLLPIDGRGGKASTVEYCHYACFNLLVKLQEESQSQ